MARDWSRRARQDPRRVIPEHTSGEQTGGQTRRQLLISAGRIGVGAAAAAGLGSLVAACGVAPGQQSSPTTAAKAAEPIRVAHLQTLHMPSLYATHPSVNGYQELPFPVERVEFGAGPAMVEALVAGSVDVLQTGVVPAIFASANNVPAKTVMAQVYGVRDFPGLITALLVKSDSSIKSFKDLDGKTVGILGFGTLLDLESAMLERHYQLPRSRFKMTAVSYPEAGQALQKGQVDAVWHAEPGLTGELIANRARVLATSLDVVPHLASGCLMASDRLIKARPDDLRQLMTAHIKIYRWIMANYDKARAVIGEVTKAPADVSAKMGLGYWPANGTLSARSILSQARVLKELNLLKVPDDDVAFVDTWFKKPVAEFLDPVLTKLGKAEDPIAARFDTDPLPLV